jgi:F-type H+-transporting ATPase subunit O
LNAKKKGLLADNGRLGRLRGIANQFATIMSAHRGEIAARVTTAKPLDSAQLKELQTVLQTFVKKGHSLKIETRVDAGLIGGLVVELGDRYVDLSISSKLKVYDQIVKETL